MLRRCHADPLILPNPFFHFKQFSILYQDKGLRVTTDSCLLGAICAKHAPPEPKTILDIGTGTGVIALMLAQRFRDARVQAVEMQEDIAKQAHLNFEASPFAEQLMLLHTDFLKLTPSPFDLIVCNPPYFINHLSGNNDQKNTAMHNTTLDHKALMEHAGKFMHKSSRFSLVLPHDLMPSRLQMAEETGLHLIYRCDISNRPGQPYRTVAILSKTPGELKSETLEIQDNNGNKSMEFKALMEDYYLDDSSRYKTRAPIKNPFREFNS